MNKNEIQAIQNKLEEAMFLLENSSRAATLRKLCEIMGYTNELLMDIALCNDEEEYDKDEEEVSAASSF